MYGGGEPPRHTRKEVEEWIEAQMKKYKVIDDNMHLEDDEMHLIKKKATTPLYHYLKDREKTGSIKGRLKHLMRDNKTMKEKFSKWVVNEEIDHNVSDTVMEVIDNMDEDVAEKALFSLEGDEDEGGD